MSFAYVAKIIRVCELPNSDFSSSVIQSVQMILGADGASGNYELDPIGFEYGECTDYQIEGDISSIDVSVIPRKGIHRMQIKAGQQIYDLGRHRYNDDHPQLYTETLQFTSDLKMVGFEGNWKFNGLQKLAALRISPVCAPKGGVFVPLVPEPKPEPEVVYVELPAPEAETVEVEVEVEKDNTMLVVLICAVALAGICLLNLILCRLCIGKYKNRIKVLESAKIGIEPSTKPTLGGSPRWDNQKNSRKRKIAVGSAIPEDEEQSEAVEIDTMRYEMFDESSRQPLKDYNGSAIEAGESSIVVAPKLEAVRSLVKYEDNFDVNYESTK